MFAYVKELINDLIYDAPLMGMFLCGAVSGFGFGLYYNLTKFNSRLPSALRSVLVCICMPLSVAALLLLFPIAFNLLFDGFFKGLLLALLGYAVSIIVILVPLRLIKKSKLKQNPVLHKLIAQIKATSPAYVILCLDGIATLNAVQLGTFRAELDIECATKQKFDSYSYLCHCTSVQKFCDAAVPAPVSFISFHKEGYPKMTPEEAAMFMELFCQNRKEYSCVKHSCSASYTEAASKYTAKGTYYTINGNLAGGPSTISSSEKRYGVLLDVYFVATRQNGNAKG